MTQYHFWQLRYSIILYKMRQYSNLSAFLSLFAPCHWLCHWKCNTLQNIATSSFVCAKHDIRYSHMGIFLFPRHCIFHFAILKFLSIRIQNADVAYIFKMLRWHARNRCQSKFKSRATCEPLTRNAKCNYLKNDRTQQNNSNSINVFMLQN